MSLSRFARLLGLPAHQAEDALHSERAARAVLTRRSFFAASGAMAAGMAGTAFSFPRPRRHVWVNQTMPWERGAPARTVKLETIDDLPLGAPIMFRPWQATDGETLARLDGSWSLRDGCSLGQGDAPEPAEIMYTNRNLELIQKLQGMVDYGSKAVTL